ncbi:MAG: metalloregulator ArsR/SmtB family transcription factor [Polyangiaceae bacterium]
MPPPRSAARAADIDRTLAALGEPTRRQVVDLLRVRAHRAGELAEALGTSAPAMSRHLRVLRESGLTEEEDLAEDGRVRIIRLRRERFTELSAWLADVDAFWSDQLGAFKAHAERTRGRRTRRGAA